jgi:hypothetical protein
MKSAIVRASIFGLGVLLMAGAVGSTEVLGYVTPVAAPEIDGATLSSGIAGLSAAVLMLKARRRSK